MFNWKRAIFLAVIFLIVAVIYFVGWHEFFPAGTDYSGAVMLGALGIAMAFGFMVLLKNSREL